MEGKDRVSNGLRRPLSKEPRCKGPCLQYDYKKWHGDGRPQPRALVLNLLALLQGVVLA